MKNTVLSRASALKASMIRERRFLHEHPETGFELEHTLGFVKEELISMGITPERCGKSGIAAAIGNNKQGKTFLLRADMDALPIREEADVPFASKNGNMHACGHDMHTAMLLGAAGILKEHEAELCGTVKLMFQPAEEIFQGAEDMISGGILESPSVDAAMMLHVMSGLPLPTDTLIISSPGAGASAADFFDITIKGKGCHGSMPSTGIDPISIASHIIIALQEINSRELSMDSAAALTIGRISAGSAPNIIPDTAVLSGSLRTFSEDVRSFIKRRIEDISRGIASAFRAEADIRYYNSCPALINDRSLSISAEKYAKELLGSKVKNMTELGGGKVSGSEDFAFISRQTPSLMLALNAGEPDNGICYPQHHPKVRFSEDVLPTGAAALAYIAMRWLKDNS